jgi:hypothetical protein
MIDQRLDQDIGSSHQLLAGCGFRGAHGRMLSVLTGGSLGHPKNWRLRTPAKPRI